jgi:hypothetical protein
LRSRVRVIGNVHAENHRAVTLADSIVGGSVQLKQGGSARVTGNRITGDLQFDANSGRITAKGNTIGGQSPDVLQHRRHGDLDEPDRRQPAVQVQPATADGRRETSSGATRRISAPGSEA